MKKERNSDKNLNNDLDENPELDMLVIMLDNFSSSETGRLKVSVSEDIPEGYYEKKYHHGRCDIDSPWACGKAFDVLE